MGFFKKKKPILSKKPPFTLKWVKTKRIKAFYKSNEVAKNARMHRKSLHKKEKGIYTSETRVSHEDKTSAS